MRGLRIYFIRHGEVHNPRKVLYGRLPGFRLSENGRNEAKILSDKLKNQGIEHIYTSPMLRARQTAGFIGSKLGLTPKISRYLIELDLIFQGMPAMEYKEKIQPYLFDSKYIKKGQESISRVFNRMSRFFKRLENKHKEGILAVVSHGDPISIFVALTSGDQFTWEYKKANYLKTGTYIILDYNDGRFKWTKQDE